MPKVSKNCSLKLEDFNRVKRTRYAPIYIDYPAHDFYFLFSDGHVEHLDTESYEMEWFPGVYMAMKRIQPTASKTEAYDLWKRMAHSPHAVMDCAKSHGKLAILDSVMQDH